MDEGAAEPDWVEPTADGPIPFWDSVDQDVLAHIPPAQRGGSFARRATRAVSIVLRSSGLHVVFLYRVSHQAYHRLGPAGRVIGGLIFWFLRHFYGCSIAATARLHGGLMMPHPQGIVLGPGCVVGPRAWVYQNVTLGGSPWRSGMPRVGRDARIFAGAVLVGPISVGDEVLIGACCVVSRDVPSRHVVRNPPPHMELRREYAGDDAP